MDEFNKEIKFMALGVMAVVPIFLGSFASLPNVLQKPREAEKVSLEEAKQFPIYGSAVLFSLFLVLKYLPAHWINIVVTVYFSAIGSFAVANTLHDLISYVAPGLLRRAEPGSLVFKIGRHELVNVAFDTLHLAALAIGVPLSAYYGFTKHWILNNILGECFSYFAIKSLNLDSFRTGMTMLAGLFVYDIFWVFGTNVMVSVAKGLDAPIKVVFPLDLAAEELKFTLLGLGDIVIPGIFIALALRFDYQLSGPGKPLRKVYFTAVFVAYVLGLVATLVAMRVFQSAQPALLYLSPACILSVLITAAIRGELSALWAFNGYQPDEDESSSKDELASSASSPSTDSVKSTKQD